MAHHRPRRWRVFLRALGRHIGVGLALMGHAGWYTPPRQLLVPPPKRSKQPPAVPPRPAADPRIEADVSLTRAERVAWLGLQGRLLAPAENLLPEE